MVTLAELPALPCPYCGRVLGTDTPWAASAGTLWGWCGAKLTVDGEVAGVLLVGPMEDAAQAMVMSAWVSPEHVGVGYGRQLVLRVAAVLIEHPVRAVLAQGSATHVRCSAPPRDFLRSVGFTRGLDERLWRLEFERTVADRGRVVGVFERLMESLRPAAPPEPAGGAVPSELR